MRSNWCGNKYDLNFVSVVKIVSDKKDKLAQLSVCSAADSQTDMGKNQLYSNQKIVQLVVLPLTDHHGSMGPPCRMGDRSWTEIDPAEN